MIFFIDRPFSSHSFLPLSKLLIQDSLLHLYLWSETKTEEIAQDLTYQIIPKDNILYALKSSLRDGKRIIVSNGIGYPVQYDEELFKKRLVVDKGHIFMSSRASFFFREGLDRIQLHDYQDLEKLALLWGK
ncbi:MAG: hypothetical protein ACOYL6_04710 [Bacteriovoracaceae bacterium]